MKVVKCAELSSFSRHHSKTNPHVYPFGAPPLVLLLRSFLAPNLQTLSSLQHWGLQLACENVLSLSLSRVFFSPIVAFQWGKRFWSSSGRKHAIFRQPPKSSNVRTVKEREFSKSGALHMDLWCRRCQSWNHLKLLQVSQCVSPGPVRSYSSGSQKWDQGQ